MQGGVQRSTTVAIAIAIAIASNTEKMTKKKTSKKTNKKRHRTATREVQQRTSQEKQTQSTMAASALESCSMSLRSESKSVGTSASHSNSHSNSHSDSHSHSHNNSSESFTSGSTFVMSNHKHEHKHKHKHKSARTRHSYPSADGIRVEMDDGDDDIIIEDETDSTPVKPIRISNNSDSHRRHPSLFRQSDLNADLDLDDTLHDDETKRAASVDMLSPLHVANGSMGTASTASESTSSRQFKKNAHDAPLKQPSESTRSTSNSSQRSFTSAWKATTNGPLHQSFTTLSKPPLPPKRTSPLSKSEHGVPRPDTTLLKGNARWEDAPRTRTKANRTRSKSVDVPLSVVRRRLRASVAKTLDESTHDEDSTVVTAKPSNRALDSTRSLLSTASDIHDSLHFNHPPPHEDDDDKSLGDESMQSLSMLERQNSIDSDTAVHHHPHLQHHVPLHGSPPRPPRRMPSFEDDLHDDSNSIASEEEPSIRMPGTFRRIPSLPPMSTHNIANNSDHGRSLRRKSLMPGAIQSDHRSKPIKPILLSLHNRTSPSKRRKRVQVRTPSEEFNLSLLLPESMAIPYEPTELLLQHQGSSDRSIQSMPNTATIITNDSPVATTKKKSSKKSKSSADRSVSTMPAKKNKKKSKKSSKKSSSSDSSSKKASSDAASTSSSSRKKKKNILSQLLVRSASPRKKKSAIVPAAVLPPPVFDDSAPKDPPARLLPSLAPFRPQPALSMDDGDIMTDEYASPRLNYSYGALQPPTASQIQHASSSDDARQPEKSGRRVMYVPTRPKKKTLADKLSSSSSSSSHSAMDRTCVSLPALAKTSKKPKKSKKKPRRDSSVSSSSRRKSPRDSSVSSRRASRRSRDPSGERRSSSLTAKKRHSISYFAPSDGRRASIKHDRSTSTHSTAATMTPDPPRRKLSKSPKQSPILQDELSELQKRQQVQQYDTTRKTTKSSKKKKKSDDVSVSTKKSKRSTKKTSKSKRKST